MARYAQKLKELKAQISFQKSQNVNTEIIDKLRSEYYSIRRNYIKAYDDLLHVNSSSNVDLANPQNLEIMKEAFLFWEGKKLHNFAYCVMPNHIHWVFGLFEKDENETPVYLQDILHSVKRHTGNRINKIENREGSLWQKESFDTTIRDDKHLYYAIEYTLNNPVKAGFVSTWEEWPGTGCVGFLTDTRKDIGF